MSINIWIKINIENDIHYDIIIICKLRVKI